MPLKVLEVIERLKEYRFSFGVEATLMRKNIDCLDQIVDALIERDVKFISFKRLYPCTEAREHDECLIGNINEQSLRDLLLSYEENDDKWIPCDCIKLPECETCSKSGSCHGGCRLRALRFHGDISKPDPFNCRLFNNVYSDMPIGQLIWGIKG